MQLRPVDQSPEPAAEAGDPAPTPWGSNSPAWSLNQSRNRWDVVHHGNKNALGKYGYSAEQLRKLVELPAERGSTARN